MNPKKIVNLATKEEYFYMKHPSGLGIYVYPKKGYSSSYAILGTNFGSINNKFKIKGQKSFTVVPNGIAHYLEHKLFASPQGDAFELFSKTGASANAYTSFEKTAYLFSCTNNFEKSLSILLDFVQSPYFTPENVEKERGIIGQEIKMYEDSPEWKVFINLLGALYVNHPVKYDIAGSIESIAKITPELLYTCYNSFYNLHNMALCVVGNLEPDKTFEMIDKQLKYCKPQEVERFFEIEPKNVAKPFIEQKFDIASSMFNLGFKENKKPNEVASTTELAYTDILMQYISSKASPMYNDLLKNELINTSSFFNEYLEGPGYASVIFSGESQKPEKAAELIREHMNALHKNGLDEKAFERAKRAVYGQNIAMFNSISSIAGVLLDFDFAGREIFEYIETLSNADINTANQMLSQKLLSENSSLSVVKPL